ncbi:MAG TPA: hypothetical protein PK129_09430, partial [Cellvibrionaceae bacterium]|nr:hypothetical protein [Cellvibrionaceae bacterium]
YIDRLHPGWPPYEAASVLQGFELLPLSPLIAGFCFILWRLLQKSVQSPPFVWRGANLRR